MAQCLLLFVVHCRIIFARRKRDTQIHSYQVLSLMRVVVQRVEIFGMYESLIMKTKKTFSLFDAVNLGALCVVTWHLLGTSRALQLDKASRAGALLGDDRALRVK